MSDITYTFKEREAAMIRQCVAHEHNLAIRRKSARPSERVMYLAALRAIIQKLDGEQE